MDSLNPISVLQSLEQDCWGNQLVESRETQDEVWRGFTFNVGELSLAVPFVGEFEIIPEQELSPIPLAKSWVRGMTNIRGEIYTVIDFSSFIGLPKTIITKRCNFFLLPDTKLKSALLIDSRISLKSFSSTLTTRDPKDYYHELSPFLGSVVVESGQSWGVIDIDALSESEEFARIGL